MLALTLSRGRVLLGMILLLFDKKKSLFIFICSIMRSHNGVKQKTLVLNRGIVRKKNGIIQSFIVRE
jgi:hypothetical protein